MNIFRELESELVEWSKLEERKPLLLRGARQTGKTYLIEKLLGRRFEKVLTVNFEKNSAFKNCFLESLSPHEIIPKLEVLLKETIVPGETLLFFDELQDCPEAITSLRYFFEELPRLHLVAAGSLLEFALGKASFPVGRVTVRHLYPLTFRETLVARGEDRFLQVLESHDFDKALPVAIHKQGLKLLHEYLVIGGMPEAAQLFLNHKSFQKTQQSLEDILELFRSDFPKYSKKRSEIESISTVFERVAQVACQQLRYVNISRDIRQDSIKACLDLLERARIITNVRPTHAIPLAQNAKDYPKKLVFIDVGLMQRASNVPLDSWISQHDFFMNKGQIAEQFIGQEILSLSNRTKPDLFYWKRDKRGSSAEIDYLVQHGPSLLPIEVKSGVSGKLRSLKMFLDSNDHIKEGIKVSSDNCSLEGRIRTVPLYAFSTWLKRS